MLVKLKDIFTFLKKSKIKASLGLDEGEYPFYTSSKILKKYVNEAIFDEKEALIFGTGGLASIHYAKNKFSTSTDCFIVKIDDERINTKYVYHYLSGNIHILEEGFHGAGLKHISKKYIENIKIPLPSLKKQKAIAKKLDKAKELIELRKASIKKLDELSKAVFVDMFGDLVENEMGWENVQLKKVLNNIDSGWSPVCHTYSRENNNNGILKLSALTDDIYHQNENKEMTIEHEPKMNHLVLKEDLLFSRKNTYERVGSCAYVFNTEDNLFMPDLIFRLNTTTKINKIFLWKYLSNEIIKIRLRNIASGASASMPNISKAKLLDFNIYYPPINLQEKFAKTIQKIEAQKALYEEALEKLEYGFEALLGESFG